MSSLIERQKVLAADLAAKNASLADILKAMGILVPDQGDVARMMEAIRLGLPETTTRRRIAFAWARRLKAWNQGTAWQYSNYEVFAAGKIFSNAEAATVPRTVREDAERIKAVLPKAHLIVHWLQHDPWLEVRLDHEGYFIRGWIGDRIIV